MAAIPLGTLKKYNTSAEQISAYLEQVRLFFIANSVSEDKQVPTFLSIVGPTTYSVLQNLFAPDQPSEKRLAEKISSV